MRGKKSTWAEGGLRVPAFIVGPGIKPETELHRLDYIHLSDWLPTFLDLAGGNENDWKNLDGKSYKGVFLNNEVIPRTEMFHNGIVTRGVSYICCHSLWERTPPKPNINTKSDNFKAANF